MYTLPKGGETPLHRAASGGEVAAIRILVEAGADVNAQRENGDMPLCLAAKSTETAAVRMLLEIGEEVCISDAAYKSIFYQDLWYQLETRETELLSEANRRWKGKG